MKVLYFSQGYSPHDDRFLKALANTEHDVHFLRLERSPSVEPPAGIHEVRLMNVAPQKLNKSQAMVVNFKYLIDMLKPDLVHAGPVHGPAYVAARAGFSPLVTMSWGSDLLYEASHFADAWMKCKYSLSRSTILVGDCQAVADKAASMGFARERIFLFPWGVDLQHFNPAGDAPLREKLGWTENFVFLSNRSFEKLYGVDVLLNAFIETEKIYPQIRMLVFGKGSLEARLKQMVSEAGISNKVHFGTFAAREDLPGIYRSADVYLSASHSDGSSVSLMEALACGRPALVSDIAGNREWINEGLNGWTFRDNDYQDLTEKMCAAVQHNELNEISRAARQTAEIKANWTTNFPVLLQAYQAAYEAHHTEKKAVDRA